MNYQPSKGATMAMTFHEVYGDVSVAQLRAYKRHNVSQSDHDELVYHLGNDPVAITAVVKDKSFHLAGSNSFSVWMWLNN